MTDANMDGVLDRLDEIMQRLDAIERRQKKSNSRIIRPALIASISSQIVGLMILVTAPSLLSAGVVALLIIANAWAIKVVVPREGEKEWPKDERTDYEPYEYEGS